MYKETRKIWANDVKELCISQGWYNAGTVKAYNNLLDYVISVENKHITTKVIEKIAADIKAHTTNSEWEGADVETYMFHLSKICFSVFEKEEQK